MSTGTENETEVAPTSVAGFKARTKLPPTKLPSGNYMLLRKTDFRTFMKSGMLPNSLMGVVQKALAKGQEPEEFDMAALVADPEKVNELADMVDNIVIFCAVDPQVHPTPSSDDVRSEDLLYVDEMDEEDKMFIFQLVTGGTSDVEEFRSELVTTLAPLQPREDVELPAVATSSD